MMAKYKYENHQIQNQTINIQDFLSKFLTEELIPGNNLMKNNEWT